MPKPNIPTKQELFSLTEFFKVLGNTTRMKILLILLEGEARVGELAEILQVTDSAVSHQLRTLRANRLVTARREGKAVFYSLADKHVRTVIAEGREHVRELSFIE